MDSNSETCTRALRWFNNSAADREKMKVLYDKLLASIPCEAEEDQLKQIEKDIGRTLGEVNAIDK